MHAQGTHTAMKSGMLAAEAAFEALTGSAADAASVDLSSYEEALRGSWVWEELQRERNIRPSCAPLCLCRACHALLWVWPCAGLLGSAV
jgi:electron-transferring-flavoprotein dehydrogenase